MENKEQGFIPFGGKLAVLDDCCIIIRPIVLKEREK